MFRSSRPRARPTLNSIVFGTRDVSNGAHSGPGPALGRIGILWAVALSARPGPLYNVSMPDQHAATVAIVGRPNVGKSTLLNALVGQKLAITSPKPQATRIPVVGILTSGATQLVLVDQPGLMDPSYLLQEAMRAAAVSWVRKADILLYLHPGDGDPPPPLETIVPELGWR